MYISCVCTYINFIYTANTAQTLAPAAAQQAQSPQLMTGAVNLNKSIYTCMYMYV